MKSCFIFYENCSHFNYFKCYGGASFLKCLLSSKVRYLLYLLLEHSQCVHLLIILSMHLSS